MKSIKAIHRDRIVTGHRNGKWEYQDREREVRVMARAEGYAMVRLKGCMPYVAPEKELHPLGKSGKPGADQA